MDSISQAVWGALTAQAVGEFLASSGTAKAAEPIRHRWLWLIGAIGGTLPDLDVLLRSATDPLFATLMHRHFTHSVFFTPLGGLLLLGMVWYWRKHLASRGLHLALICWASYATHWLLDLMTAYGTMVLWPLNSVRYALDWLSIIDPLLTIPWLIACTAVALSRRYQARRRYLCSVAIWTGVYFAFAWNQNLRALDAIKTIAQSRGHHIDEVRALPSLANSFWFRGLYRSGEQLHAVGVLVSPLGGVYWRAGESRPRWTREAIDSEIASIQPDSTLSAELMRQISVWQHFTDDWMYRAEPGVITIGDARYSTQVEAFESLWTLRLDLANPSLSRRSSPYGAEDQASASQRSPFEGFRLLVAPNGLVPLGPNSPSP